MYRRYFLANSLPLNLERFDYELLYLYKFDNITSVEGLFDNCCTTKKNWYFVSFANNYLTTKKIKKMNWKKIKKLSWLTMDNHYKKIRYYVPLTSNLNAKIDVPILKFEDYYGEFNTEFYPIINVDFNSKEEADNFEIPNWFDAELLPELMVKTKRKSK